MASAYMPDVRVEIAFNAGFLTPAADRVWTDVSEFVELDQEIEIGGGRSDARGTIDANTLVLSLDNSDGRFTPYLASSPYFPDVRLGRPIRVTAKPAGSAVTSTRFTGYVASWPTEWVEGVEQYAVARVTAVSRLARLGSAGVPLRSVLEEEHALDVPVVHYPLGEPEGATLASPSVGAADLALVRYTEVGGTHANRPLFGQGVGPPADDLTGVATKDGGDPLTVVLPVTAGSDWTIEWYFTTVDVTTSGMLSWGNIWLDLNEWLQDEISLRTPAFVANADPGGVVNDGETHHAVLQWDDSANLAELRIDGALVAAQTDASVAINGRLVVGNNSITGDPSSIPASPYTVDATFFHVSVYDSLLSTAVLARHSEAALTGFAGEAAHDRFTRYAGWAGADVGDVFADPEATTPIQAIDSTGETVVALLRKVEATEGGVLFDSRSGILTFLSRNARFNRPADVTLPADTFEAGLVPRLDDSEIFNHATADVTDELRVRADDLASQEAYGVQGIPFDIFTTDRAEAEGRCWWTVNTYGEPLVRVPDLSVDVLALPLVTQEALADVDLGDRIATTGSWPAQIGTVLDSGFFVEGYQERFGPESWVVGFNVSPASVNEVMQLNDSTYGLLGSYPLAY